MPYDDPDPTDPMTLHGVIVETENNNAMHDMARCFVEEYVRSGFDEERIMKLFLTRGYAGPHLAIQTLGEDAIHQIIQDVVSLWGGRNIQSQTTPESNSRISLTVLNQ